MPTLSHTHKASACFALAVLAAAGFWAGSATGTATCDEDCRVTCVYWVPGSPGTPVPLNYAYAMRSPCGIWHYSLSDYHYYVLSGPVLSSVLSPSSNSGNRECLNEPSPPNYYKYSGIPVCGSTGSYVAALCYECSDVPVSE
jgi:hypothetical protein